MYSQTCHRNERDTAREILSEVHEAEPGRLLQELQMLARVLLMDGGYAAAADTCRRALGCGPMP